MERSRSMTTKDFILEQSARVFNLKGYAGASMSDIMKATGLEKGGIYNHFASKEELALAAFEYGCDLGGKRIRACVEARGDDAYARLCGILDAFESFIDDSPIDGGCPLMNMSVEVDDGNPALKALVVYHLKRLEDYIASLADTGIQKGRLRQGLDSRQIAINIICSLEGAVMFARLKEPGERARVFGIASSALRQWLDSLRIPLISFDDAFRFFFTPRNGKRTRREAEYAEAARKIDLGDGLVGYSWGAREDDLEQKRVLLTHGWEGRATHWHYLLDVLLPQGFEVVAFDARAHGESTGETAHAYEFVRGIKAMDAYFGQENRNKNKTKSNNIDAAIGHSIGAVATLRAAFEGVHFDRMVLIAPAGVTGVFNRYCKRCELSDAETERFFKDAERMVGISRAEMELTHTIHGFDGGVGTVAVYHDPEDQEIPYQDSVDLERASDKVILHAAGGGHRRIIKDAKVLEGIAEFLRAL